MSDGVILVGLFILILAVLQEMLPGTVISRAIRNSKTQKSHLETSQRQSLIAETKIAVFKDMRFVTTTCFRILFTELIIRCLGFFNDYVYELLFPYLYGVFDMFVVDNIDSYVPLFSIN